MATRAVVWAWLLLGGALDVSALAAGHDRPAGSIEVEDLLRLDAVSRRARVLAWTAEAREALARAEQAVWASEQRSTRVCREARRDDARQFVDRIEVLGPRLAADDEPASRREAVARVLVQTWKPIAAIEAAAPCEPDASVSDGVSVQGPPLEGLAGLPELIEDDPLTIGFEVPGRRTLRR